MIVVGIENDKIALFAYFDASDPVGSLKGGSSVQGQGGVQVITVQRILDFFNNDVMPIVYDRGSLGASGDLAPLANLFLPLIGVGFAGCSP